MSILNQQISTSTILINLAVPEPTVANFSDESGNYAICSHFKIAEKKLLQMMQQSIKR
jgi:hypothetical protein